jgi:hypothetical protein
MSPALEPKVALSVFARQYGVPHLVFAMHAAFPLAVTPDLLYRMWATFIEDIDGAPLEVPWIAVADLLLSGFCSQISFELFTIRADFQRELLARLERDKRFGPRRLTELSRFIAAYYHEHLNDASSLSEIANTQRWFSDRIGIAYINPTKFVESLTPQLTSSFGSEELQRLAGIVDRLPEGVSAPIKQLAASNSLAQAERSPLHPLGNDQRFGERPPSVPELSESQEQSNNYPSPRESLVRRSSLIILVTDHGEDFKIVIGDGQSQFPPYLVRQEGLRRADRILQSGAARSYNDAAQFYKVCINLGQDLALEVFRNDAREWILQQMEERRFNRVVVRADGYARDIPWEIIHISSDRGSDGVFLSEPGLVRSEFGRPGLSKDIAINPEKILLVRGPFDKADNLSELILQIGSGPRVLVPQNARAFYELFQEAEYDLVDLTKNLHSSGDQVVLATGDKDVRAIRPHEIRLMRTRESKNHPFVVATACGLQGPLAAAFWELGARMFIGTLWPSLSEEANFFSSIVFYEMLARGMEVSEASYIARRRLRSDGSLTWLSSVVYADPETRLVLRR